MGRGRNNWTEHTYNKEPMQHRRGGKRRSQDEKPPTYTLVRSGESRSSPEHYYERPAPAEAKEKRASPPLNDKAETVRISDIIGKVAVSRSSSDRSIDADDFRAEVRTTDMRVQFVSLDNKKPASEVEAPTRGPSRASPQHERPSEPFDVEEAITLLRSSYEEVKQAHGLQYRPRNGTGRMTQKECTRRGADVVRALRRIAEETRIG